MSIIEPKVNKTHSVILKRGRAHQAGVTLIELVISIVIVSIAMVTLLSSFSVSLSASADPLIRNKTLKLAQLYMDEILAKNYDHNTPVGGLPFVASPTCIGLGAEVGETRATFNDVDDYDGLDDSPPENIDGSLDSSYNSYRVQVSVACDTPDVVSASGTEHAKKIELTITAPDGNGSQYLFSAYKGNY